MVPIYSKKTDVYAFAIILWELAHWKASYVGISLGEIRDSIKGGDRLPIDEKVPPEFKDLIETSWKMNPKERTTFTDLIAKLKTISDKKTDADLVGEGGTLGYTILSPELQEKFFKFNEAEYTTSMATNNVANTALVKFWVFIYAI